MWAHWGRWRSLIRPARNAQNWRSLPGIIYNLWRSALYIYSEEGRKDLNHTVSLGLSYRFNEWMSIFGSSYATWNSSNQPVFEYDTVNAGGGLTLTLEF